MYMTKKARQRYKLHVSPVTDSGIQIEGIIKIPDQCQVSTRTDPDIDHQEVEHYIHDLLERYDIVIFAFAEVPSCFCMHDRVMDNVRTEFIANEQKTAATSDDNTPPDVGVSSKSSMPATVDDEDIDHQEVGNDIHGLLERCSDHSHVCNNHGSECTMAYKVPHVHEDRRHKCEAL